MVPEFSSQTQQSEQVDRRLCSVIGIFRMNHSTALQLGLGLNLPTGNLLPIYTFALAQPYLITSYLKPY